MERPIEIVQSPKVFPGDSERGGARTSLFSLGFFGSHARGGRTLAKFFASKKIKKSASFGTGLMAKKGRACRPRLAFRPLPEG